MSENTISSQRYEEIKTIIAEFLEDYDVRELPINVFALAEQMGCKITRASEMPPLNPKNHPGTDRSPLLSSDGFNLYDEENKRIVIFLNDFDMPINRQRFTIAHEIAHIILGHHEQGPIIEQEADFAAAYLLAPVSLCLLPGSSSIMDDPAQIQEVFQISNEAAWNAWDRFQTRWKYLCIPECDYEGTINSLLGNSFRKKLEERRTVLAQAPSASGRANP